MKSILSRRLFLQKSVTVGVGLATIPNFTIGSNSLYTGMKLGLTTYQWGKDWDLPTLIANCEKAGISGVELRTQHAHGVEINLNATQRAEVKKRFADSRVTCVGYGSNFEFHSPDKAVLRHNIEQTKEYIKLCKDIGTNGIKVKPNGLPAEIPKEITIAQIAASLNEVGRFAQDYGQLVRLEVHGNLTQRLSNIKAIFDQVTEPNVKVCWNGDDTDLLEPGLEGNFNLVKKWIGDTVHVRGFRIVDYPYQQLFDLLAGISFKGCILIESETDPNDKILALKEQFVLFKQLVANIKRA